MNHLFRSVEDYERLRASALGAASIKGPDLGLVRNQGLAIWLQTPCPLSTIQPSCADNDRRHRANVDAAVVPVSELACLIAGIVMALATEVVHG